MTRPHGRRCARIAVILAGASAAVVPGLGAQSSVAAGEPALVAEWRFDELDGQIAVDDGPHRLDGRLGGTDAPEADDPLRIEGALGPRAALHWNDVRSLARKRRNGCASRSRPKPWCELRAARGSGATSYLVAAKAVPPGLMGSTRRRPAAWPCTSSMERATSCRPRRGPRTCGTARGTTSPAASTVARCGCSWTAARSVSPSIPRWSLTTPPLPGVRSIGEYAGACALSFRGDIDLVRLWSGARSPEALATAARESAAPLTGATGTLPAAAPPTVLPADDRRSPARQDRACVVRLLGTASARKRRTLMRVRVTVGRRPLRGARVVARERGGRRVLARARTNAKGRARLVLSRRGPRHVRISTQNRPGCLPVTLRLRRT